MCARAFVAARRPLLHGDDATRARTSSRLARSQVRVLVLRRRAVVRCLPSTVLSITART